MKKIISLWCLIGLMSCSGATGPGVASPQDAVPPDVVSQPTLNKTLRVLSLNIIFGTAQAAEKSVGKGIDTTTQVLASNVVLDNTQLGLQATNLQDAMAEIMPFIKPIDHIVGNWIISDDGTNVGTIQFNADKTFSCSGHNVICAGASPMNYSFIGNRLVVLHWNDVSRGLKDLDYVDANTMVLAQLKLTRQ